MFFNDLVPILRPHFLTFKERFICINLAKHTKYKKHARSVALKVPFCGTTGRSSGTSRHLHTTYDHFYPKFLPVTDNCFRNAQFLLSRGARTGMTLYCKTPILWPQKPRKSTRLVETRYFRQFYFRIIDFYIAFRRNGAQIEILAINNDDTRNDRNENAALSGTENDHDEC